MASPSMTAEQVLAVMEADARAAADYRYTHITRIPKIPAEEYISRLGDSATARAAVRAAFEELEARQWRGIETAPKDGREIILCGNAGRPYAGYWSRFDAFWLDHAKSFRAPTRWQPLPPPPKEPDRER